MILVSRYRLSGILRRSRIMARLERRCFKGGRAKGAAIYLKRLCIAVCKGLQEQEKLDNMIEDMWLQEVAKEEGQERADALAGGA